MKIIKLGKIIMRMTCLDCGTQFEITSDELETKVCLEGPSIDRKIYRIRCPLCESYLIIDDFVTLKALANKEKLENEIH